MSDIDPAIEHRLPFEDSDVLALTLEALRRDLDGSPWYERLLEAHPEDTEEHRKIARDALTASVIASMNEILPGFALFAKAIAVEGAITAIGQMRGAPQPIGTIVEGELAKLVLALEADRDQLIEGDTRGFFEFTEDD